MLKSAKTDTNKKSIKMKAQLIVNTMLVHTRNRWAMISPTFPDSITHLRPLGGSSGMWTFMDGKLPPEAQTNPELSAKLSVITDDQITDYCNFVSDKGIATCYMLNTNDTVENSIELLGKFIDSGANITHLEVGQELYLPKFRKLNGPIVPGYVRQFLFWDYMVYCTQIIPLIKAILPDAKVLLNICYENGVPQRAKWNADIQGIIKTNPGVIDGFVMHLYEGGNNLGGGEEATVMQADFTQFDKYNLPLYFTETGQKLTDYTVDGLATYRDFIKRIYDYCESRGDGSIAGVQLLFLRKAGKGMQIYGALYNEDGPTPLAAELAKFPFEDVIVPPLPPVLPPTKPVVTITEIRFAITFYGRQMVVFSDGTFMWTPWLWWWNQLEQNLVGQDREVLKTLKK